MNEQLRTKAWMEIANHFGLDYVGALDIFDPSGSLENLSFNALLELQNVIDCAIKRILKSEGYEVQ